MPAALGLAVALSAVEGVADAIAAAALVAAVSRRPLNAPSNNSTVRSALEAAVEPWATSARRCSVFDSAGADDAAASPVANEAPASGAAVDAAVEASLDGSPDVWLAGAVAGCRISSTRDSMRAIDCCAASTTDGETGAVYVGRGAASEIALGVDIADIVDADIGVPKLDVVDAGASPRGVTIDSPDQIGERSAIAGRPAPATDDTAPATTSAAAAAAKSTPGDQARSPAPSPPLIDGATAAITSGDSTGIATPAQLDSPLGVTKVPRVVIAPRRWVDSRPMRAAAIQSSSSWNHGRGKTHDTCGTARSLCPVDDIANRPQKLPLQQRYRQLLVRSNIAARVIRNFSFLKPELCGLQGPSCDFAIPQLRDICRRRS
jgi:hypothetical protein